MYKYNNSKWILFFAGFCCWLCWFHHFISFYQFFDMLMTTMMETRRKGVRRSGKYIFKGQAGNKGRTETEGKKRKQLELQEMSKFTCFVVWKSHEECCRQWFLINYSCVSCWLFKGTTFLLAGEWRVQGMKFGICTY